ncbi:MAG: hypothetical protein LBQ13_04260 [Endomicrobium sp.]|jgi:hypothetical protein|nr:hypothetical protein [Endomicrobium sp.]
MKKALAVMVVMFLLAGQVTAQENKSASVVKPQLKQELGIGQSISSIKVKRKIAKGGHIVYFINDKNEKSAFLKHFPTIEIEEGRGALYNLKVFFYGYAVGAIIVGTLIAIGRSLPK